MATDGEIVKTGKFEVGYTIRTWEMDGKWVFDWTRDNGDESDQWYDTAEDAEHDATMSY